MMVPFLACASAPELRVEVEGAPGELVLRAASADGGCARTAPVVSGEARFADACPGPVTLTVAGAGWGVVDHPPCLPDAPCRVEVVPFPVADGAWLRRAERWAGLTTDLALAELATADGPIRAPVTLPATWTRLDPGDTLHLRGAAAELVLHPLVAGPERVLTGAAKPVRRGPWPELGPATAPPGSTRSVQGVPTRAVGPLDPGWWVLAAPGGDRGFLLEVPTP